MPAWLIGLLIKLIPDNISEKVLTSLGILKSSEDRPEVILDKIEYDRSKKDRRNPESRQTDL